MSERRRDLHEANRQSWNHATRAHNAHKRDQAGWLRGGGEALYDEDYELLGELDGRRVLHLQCNSGQDTLCIARRGAQVTGVDISDEAIEFARALSAESGIPASFERADIYDWMPRAIAEGRRFDCVYASYGALCWLSDLDAWARGVAALLEPGGTLVVLEFHTVAMCFDLDRSPELSYFGGRRGGAKEWKEGVGDYVGEAGEGLAPMGFEPSAAGSYENPHPCYEFSWTVADKLAALRRAGLELERFEEYPHANGCRVYEELELGKDRRWRFPAGAPDFPLMLGLEARKPEGVPMFQVDAFCDGGPFTGNPAAVCLLDTWPEDATLQAVAAENNLSETAFLRCPDPVEAPARWELRWFTPSVEVELCGHATLAAGCVLLEEVARELDEVRFSSASGELCVRKDKDSHALTVELPLGTSAEQPAPAGLLAALGLAPEAVVEQRRAAAGTWLVVVGDEAEVRGLAPDMRALAAVPPGEVIVSAPAGPDSPGCDFVSRFFGPGVGIDEDPVTGSAHCVLAPYWAERLGKATLRARQLSTRGGTLEVAIEDRRVALTGRCAVVLRGALTRCGMR